MTSGESSSDWSWRRAYKKKKAEKAKAARRIVSPRAGGSGWFGRGHATLKPADASASTIKVQPAGRKLYPSLRRCLGRVVTTP